MRLSIVGHSTGLSSVSDRTTNVAFLLARYGTEESANLRILLERAFYPVSIAERNVDLVFPKFFRTFVNGMPVEEIKGRINRGKLVRSAVERNDDLFDYSVETFPERCHESCPNLWDGDSAIVGYPSIHSLPSLKGDAVLSVLPFNVAVPNFLGGERFEARGDGQFSQPMSLSKRLRNRA